MRARRGGGLGAEIKAPASEMVCLALTPQLDAAERRDMLRHTRIHVLKYTTGATYTSIVHRALISQPFDKLLAALAKCRTS
jgi:hypothetical protein